MPIYCSRSFWTPPPPRGSEKGPMKYNLSAPPSRHLSGCFLEIGPLDLSKFRHAARIPYEVVYVHRSCTPCFNSMQLYQFNTQI